MPSRKLRPFLSTDAIAGRIAKRQEQKMASRLGGRRQLASGAMPGHRGDVLTDEWLGEVKFTAARSFRLTLRALRKIEKEAASIGRQPFFAIEFRRDGEGEMWVIVPRYVADEFLGDLEADRGTGKSHTVGST
jgi:hypothetical protein